MAARRTAASEPPKSGGRQASVPQVVEAALREGTFTVEKFVEAFPVLVEAAGGTRKLREMVRDLAVRGRLQTHRESDGRASSLLATTRVPAVSVRAGSRPVNDDNSAPNRPPPALLPDSWTWTAFSNVATIASKLVNPAKHQRMPHVAPDNIEKGTGRLLPYSTIAEDGVTSGKHHFYAGQVLYSKIRPNLNKVVAVNFDGLCSADMYPLTPRFDARYLQLFMLSDLFLSQVVRSDNRLAMPKVNQEQLNDTVVALPPLAEQKRIVTRVDQLMALIDDLEQKQTRKREIGARFTKASLEALTTAEGPKDFDRAWKLVVENWETVLDRPEKVGEIRRVVLELAIRGTLLEQNSADESAEILRRRISDRIGVRLAGSAQNGQQPFLLPPGWCWARLPELGAFGRGKSKHRPRNDPKLFHDGKYPMVQTGDVARSNGRVTSYTALYGAAGLAQSKLWPKGTLCITIAANIADSGILAFDACFPDSVVGFVPDDELDGAHYFEYFLRTAKQHIEDFAPSTAQKNINLEILSAVLVPLPPKREMKRIVAKVDQLMALCDQLEAVLRRANDRAAKLVEAVVGEMVG